MCGIIGIVTEQEQGARAALLAGLRRLEYRGYDSAGLALVGQSIAVYKAVGQVSALEAAVPDGADAGTGIAHTRWATHGAPTERNAHPHMDCKNRVVVVHNGIIENHAALRRELESRGHRFRSETDTEIIAHLMEEHLPDGRASAEAAFAALQAAVARLVGSWALAVTIAGQPRVLLGARRDAPLLLGRTPGGVIVASDATAAVEHTRDVSYLEDGDVFLATPDGFRIVDETGAPVERAVGRLEWDLEEAQRGGYPHFMLKEIHESPRAIAAALAGRLHPAPPLVRLEWGLGDELLLRTRGVLILACGTSYYAGLVARSVIERLTGLPVQVENASEYRYSPSLREPPRLAIAVTQSGETADTLAAMREARRRGHSVVAVTNVVASTAARDADGVVYLRAGPEIGVAATKSFHAQLAVLYLAALRLAEVTGSLNRAALSRFIAELLQAPRLVSRTLARQERIRDAARLLEPAKSIFYLGRQVLYPVALEGALKLKEISYIHAEGYAGGELKHGPFALLTKDTPVVGLLALDEVREKMASNIMEVRARGAPVLLVTTEGDTDAETYADEVVEVPACDPLLAPFPHTAALHLLAYEVAAMRGCSIDKPRNLAKSVTVE